ncbi:MAG: hydroxymyristoyl-ACP dehydratase [Prevotellaceae bacterium]|jgi:3-hydroxyacyl-[acyl-carrier-protein] dehydratase|nr:hydroxymyristoyl-ACP dehydratase [Prevotellaceae bacterium]
MILDNFFSITAFSGNESGYSAVIKLNPEHPVYQGHFPEQPVVPGVCTMHIVKTCAEKAIGRALTYAYVAQCRYIAIITPDMEQLSVCLQLTEQAERWLLNAEVCVAETVMMRLKAELILCKC